MTNYKMRLDYKELTVLQRNADYWQGRYDAAIDEGASGKTLEYLNRKATVSYNVYKDSRIAFDKKYEYPDHYKLRKNKY